MRVHSPAPGAAAAIATLAVVAALAPSPARAQLPWSRTYGGAAGEQVHAIAETAGGDLVVAASTDSFGTTTGDAWLIRLDAAGTVLSQAVVGNAAPGGVDGAVVLPDGGAVFGSRNVRDFFLQHDATITRVAADGTPAWTTDIAASPGRFFVNDLIAARDGGIVGVGQAAMSDAGPSIGWIVRLDAGGTVTWQQYHGGVMGTDLSFDAGIETADGGYAMAGWTASSTGQDLLVAKTSSAGALSWALAIGGSGQDRGNAIAEMPGGGGFVVAGATDSYTSSGHAGWIVRVDNSGFLLDATVLGDAEWSDLQAITVLADGSVVVLGRIGEPGFPTNDLWLVRFDASGAITSQRAHAGNSGDDANEILPLAGGELLLGATWASGFPEQDLWLLRTDASGDIPGCPAVRDTHVATSKRSPTVARLFQPPFPPFGTARTGVVATATSALTEATRCTATGCPALTCGAITAAPLPACEGTDVTLSLDVSGGTAPIAVSWDTDGDTAPDLAGNPVSAALAPGTHVLTAFASDGCLAGPKTCNARTAVTVHPDQTPTITADGPTTFCATAGDSVTLDAGPGHASYQWSRDGSDLPLETAQQLVATVSGAYAVRIVDVNGCTWTSAPVTVDAEACTGCVPLTCDAIGVVPDEACESTDIELTLTTGGGTGAVSVRWDLDGDTAPETPGNPVFARLPAGVTRITAFATDTCPTGPSACSLPLDVNVRSSAPPGEVSDVVAGAVPLLVFDRGHRVSFEDRADAVAYNVYADAIGSWYAPMAPLGSDCFVVTSPGTAGRLEITPVLQDGVDTWLVVTASTRCTEGSAGRDSFGRERTSRGSWSRCGAAP